MTNRIDKSIDDMSQKPHRIQLRKAWRVEHDPDGLRWMRTFHWTAKLDPGEQVWIVLAKLLAPSNVQLNGELLGRLSETEKASLFEVTGQLRLTNELVIEMAIPTGMEEIPPNDPGDVALLIQSGATSKTFLNPDCAP